MSSADCFATSGEGTTRRIAGVYNMRSCTLLRKTNDPLGRETVSVRREALATKKRLLVPSLPPRQVDSFCLISIAIMILMKCR